MNQLVNKSTVQLSAGLLIVILAYQTAPFTYAESVNLSIGFFPENTARPMSMSADPFDIFGEAFKQRKEIEIFFALIAPEDPQRLLDAIVDLNAKVGIPEFDPIDTIYYLNITPFDNFLFFPEDKITAAIESFVNSDPFIGFEGAFTNNTNGPLDINISFNQGTIPIPIGTQLKFETILSAEVTDTSGDATASAGSVFASYGRTLSDVTAPTVFNTVTSEAAVDGVTNLVHGVLATDSTGPRNLFVGNLDVDFFDGLGVPEEDRGTIAMTAGLFIEDLSPGDTITVRYGYSIGTEDGLLPFFPAEALVAGLEQDVFSAANNSADFNSDGDVDSDDLAQWVDDFGQNVDSDADNDDDSDGADFLTWQQQFGSGNGVLTSVLTVPEPSSLLQACFFSLLATCFRHSIVGWNERYRCSGIA